VTNKALVVAMWLAVVFVAGVTLVLVTTLGWPWPGGETTTVDVEKQLEPKPTAGSQLP
jgi:hypothetical protein